MAIECNCPHCAAFYRLDERFAGKMGRCKNGKCQQSILIPFHSTTSTAQPFPPKKIDADIRHEGKLFYVPTTTGTLFSFLLCAMLWYLTGALFLARWLCAPAWFGSNREWAALSLSGVLTLYHYCWGRKKMQAAIQATHGRQHVMSYGQAFLVVIFVLSEAALLTALFVFPR
jgi:hypothetical protein